jgi:hypothetical protein
MEKENMTIIDVSEFPDPVSEAFLFMPEDEEEQMNIYCEYIQLSTSAPSGTTLESGFYCRQEMDDGELCDGTIEVTQIDLPKQVRWNCRRCGDMGALVNYEDTVWDNSHLNDDEKERFLERFFSDIEGEDFEEDDLFGFDEEEIGPFDHFEYYLNPYNPDEEQPSPERIKELLECDWLNPDSPIYLRKDLPLEEVEQSFFFYNARQFLILLNREGPFKLTRMGHLKRRVIRQLLEVMRWPDNYIENIRKYKQGKLDEPDIWLLHGIRVLLELSELVEVNEDDSEIRLVEEKTDLLDVENAGELYRLLFSAYFKDMNLGYLGSSFEFPHLQYSVPFILYKMRDAAQDWVPIKELVHDILLFSVKIELNFAEGFGDGTALELDLLYEDLFAALERFALLETKSTSSAPADTPEHYPDHVRITDLYKNFIRV